MRALSVVSLFVAGCTTAIPAGGKQSLQHGREVVEKMLAAIQNHDQGAFDAVVVKGTGVIVTHMVAPLDLNLTPTEHACGAGTITEVEPSNLADNGTAVTVAWKCKPDEPDWDGSMAIKFHVQNGKVAIGERI